MTMPITTTPSTKHHRALLAKLSVIKLLLFSFLLLQATAQAATPYFNRGGIAIGGYDTVAYFSEAKAVPGNSQYSYDWSNTTWHFSSAANRQAFIDNPEKYAPQYNGYCSYAASENYIYSINPQAWTVYDGKLYLNAGFGTKTSFDWSKESRIRNADRNWPRLKKQL